MENEITLIQFKNERRIENMEIENKYREELKEKKEEDSEPQRNAEILIPYPKKLLYYIGFFNEKKEVLLLRKGKENFALKKREIDQRSKLINAENYVMLSVRTNEKKEFSEYTKALMEIHEAWSKITELNNGIFPKRLLHSVQKAKFYKEVKEFFDNCVQKSINEK